VVADGSEGYTSESGVLRAIDNVQALLAELLKEGGFEEPAPSGPVGGGRFA
jgi:hypothetical protein